MNNLKSVFTVLLGLCLTVLFTQCGGETKKATDNAADKAGEMVDDAADAMKDAADKAGDMADDAAKKVEDGLTSMEGKEGMLNYEPGTWEYNVLQGITTGNTTVFTLDQIPYEGEELTEAGKAQLDHLAEILKANPDWKAEIQGHTSKAQKLGNGGVRAKWVQTKLVVGRGVSNKQLTSKGYGAENLLPNVPEEDDKHKRITIALTKNAEEA